VESDALYCCELAWPVLPIRLKLESNSSVSDGLTVFETRLEKVVVPSSLLVRAFW
jgi:hypothetical protein